MNFHGTKPLNRHVNNGVCKKEFLLKHHTIHRSQQANEKMLYLCFLSVMFSLLLHVTNSKPIANSTAAIQYLDYEKTVDMLKSRKCLEPINSVVKIDFGKLDFKNGSDELSLYGRASPRFLPVTRCSKSCQFCLKRSDKCFPVIKSEDFRTVRLIPKKRRRESSVVEVQVSVINHDECGCRETSPFGDSDHDGHVKYYGIVHDE